jgi:hypothetical protein
LAQDFERRAERAGNYLDLGRQGRMAAQLAATPLSRERVGRNDQEQLSTEGNGLSDIIVDPVIRSFRCADNAPPVLLHDQVRVRGSVTDLYRLTGVSGCPARLSNLAQPTKHNIIMGQIACHIASVWGSAEVRCRRFIPERSG